MLRTKATSIGRIAALAIALSWFGLVAQAQQCGEDTINFARPEDITAGLDTANHFNLVNFGLERHIYDYLVELDPQGDLHPSLATSWETSADGLTWTFHLRDGVTFHNGEAFTSASVKTTLDRFLSGQSFAQGFLWADLASVETPDDRTVLIHTKNAFGPIISNLTTTPMLPAQAFAEQGDAFWDHPIGTGPFMFGEWVRGDRIVLVANENYWREGMPAVGCIVYRPILDPSTALAAFQSGQVDIVDSVPPDLVSVYEMVPGTQIARGLAWDQLYLGIKVDKAPFTDERVRMALNYAIDRTGIVDNIMEGGRPSVGIAPEGALGFHDGLEVFPYDPDRARELLADAGVSDVRIRLIAPEAWYPKIREVTEVIRSNLADVGIETDLQIMEGGAFIQARGAGDYDLYLTGGSSIAADPDFLAFQRVNGDVFKSGYVDQETFDLIQQARNTTDRDQRGALYRQAQERMYQQAAPFIWLFQMENIYALNDDIGGFVFAPNKIFDLRTASLRQ